MEPTAMMTLRSHPPTPKWAIALLLILAGATGALVVVSPVAAVSAQLLLIGGIVLMRYEHLSEFLVGAYWITFCAYETIFKDVQIDGLFYPFYALMLVGILLRVGFAEIRKPRITIFWYVAFLLVVLLSFVGFTDPIAFAVIQRILAYVFGLLIVLQVASQRGVTVVAHMAILSSTILSVWVIVVAIQGGFAYRGGVEGDQNVIAMFIGLGAVIAFGRSVHGLVTRNAGATALSLLLSAVSIYALLLLASRGITIAFAITAGAMFVRLVAQAPKTVLPTLLLVVALSGASFLLPGGSSLVQRFSGERVESGGSRLPLWEATWSAYTESDATQLLIGHGFDSSKALIRQVSYNLTSTHNAYFQVLYEFGLAGLAVFLALHAAIMFVSWRIPSPSGWEAFALVWFLLGSALTINVPDGFMYWTALGFTLAVVTWIPTAVSRSTRGRRAHPSGSAPGRQLGTEGS